MGGHSAEAPARRPDRRGRDAGGSLYCAPMNYRHAFHAGNFADVHKHVVLLALLRALTRKDTPLAYIDTHAGAGTYDLGGESARRTGEADAGIGRLGAAGLLPTAVADYLAEVRGFDAGRGLYPGSPLLAARVLRPRDRLLLCEVQPAECAALRLALAGDARAQVMERDGYAALKALLPPRERRGLVLIDPPYEAQEAEFDAITAALEAAIARFATGVYVVWYPIKRRATLAPFHRWLRGCGLRRVLVAELRVHGDDSPLRLNGSGMAILNTPWQVDASIAEALPRLRGLLSDDGDTRLEWLVGD
jgi:23S rRNA (adenine2030-N6)-methyltransferase